MVDAHSELMTQYPWGFTGTVPNASDNAAGSRRASTGAASCSATPGRLPGESADHSYTAIVGSDRDPVGGTTGAGHYGPFDQGRRCTGDARRPAPMPSECDDGPFGKGTGGQLRYKVKVDGAPLHHGVDRRGGLGELGRGGTQ